MDEKYKTGHVEIDQQHEALFATIDNVKANPDTPIVMELIQYVVQHFAYEETLMKQHHYPGYEVHKQKHEDIKKVVRTCKNNLLQGKPTLKELNDILDMWVKHHIGEEDKKLATFLNGK